MSVAKGLVLDANILLRAVSGERVSKLLERYENRVRFCSPHICFQEAPKYIPSISVKRSLAPERGLSRLDQLSRLVEPVDVTVYAELEQTARSRIELRDPDDWPIVAVALLLDLPIWTEDQDFFGSGIATWTTDRVELYLRQR